MLHWSKELEEIIKKEGERCQSYFWLHRESEILYNYYNNWLTIPSIILGTINGSLSVGSNAIFGDFQGASVLIGFIGIFTAILASINSYFGNSKRAEAHKVASLIYENLNRTLTIELSLNRIERTPADQLIKIIKEDLNKINEITPPICETIIAKYKKTFGKPHVAVPSICNGLDAIIINSKIDITPVNSFKEIKQDNQIKIGFEV